MILTIDEQLHPARTDPKVARRYRWRENPGVPIVPSLRWCSELNKIMGGGLDWPADAPISHTAQLHSLPQPSNRAATSAQSSAWHD